MQPCGWGERTARWDLSPETHAVPAAIKRPGDVYFMLGLMPSAQVPPGARTVSF